MDDNRHSENKPITIYDIAKEAGVSAATVSRVLTNSAKVRPEKRAKIEELIKKYHFKPNALARGLADTKSKTIGIIAADVRNVFYAEVYVACEKAAHERGYQVMLINSFGDFNQEVKALTTLQEQHVDAIIQLGGRADDMVSDERYVRKVNRVTSMIPMVITGKLEGTRCYQVQIDAMRTMELLMEHLYQLGHRRIALVGGSRQVLSTYTKFQQYRLMLEQYGIEFDPALVVDGGYNMESGYNGMQTLLEREIVPDAVIAINDFSATGVLRCLTEHGYRVPQDISIVAYDNTYIAKVSNPQLTSVDYNYDEFGRKLVETAIDAAEKREVPILQKVTPTLVVRESSGVVRK